MQNKGGGEFHWVRHIMGEMAYNLIFEVTNKREEKFKEKKVYENRYNTVDIRMKKS